jgi:hypothetical protein
MKRQTLTTIVVLLILTVHASAQNRNEGLEGLRDIAVVVKYGQEVDGLPEAMRPSLLLMLQDRARHLLKAEVPLVPEAEMAGRPRLVFTVTSKTVANVPVIDIESNLYQRVRLQRDSAKEMEVTTWKWGGIAGPITHQKVLALFDGQIDEFVKDYRAANANPPPAETRTPDPPAKLIDNASSLEGLKGIRLYVHVKFTPDDPLADERRQALEKIFESEAEKKLREAGIPTSPYLSQLLFVSISLSQPNRGSSISVDSSVSQPVGLVRAPQKEIRAVTWESRASERVPPTDEAVSRIMNSQLDEFIKVYNAANPKLSSTSN